MIRYCALFFCFFFINSYAVTADTNKKKIPIDYHVDHPDHVPHHGWKNPVKKIGGDDGVFPRKRKEWGEEGE
jgi:hypothetical protein